MRSTAVTRAERTRKRITEGNLVWAVFRFGIPLVVGMVLHTSFNLVDMLMISRLPDATAALAAMGVCDMVAAVATILASGISTATVALVARAQGRGDLTALRRAAWQSMLVTGALSIFFGLLGLVGSDLVIRGLMQVKGESADLAVDYLTVSLGGCFSIFFLLQITAILRALGHSKTAASLLIGGNVLNAFLAIFLIYGPGPAPSILAWAEPISSALGIPRLGMIGAAWATLIARTVPCVIGAILLGRRRSGPRFHMVYLRPFWPELRTIVRIAWPSSGQLVLRILTILVLISLISASYTTAGDQSTLTAYSICLRLETMALFIGMGWGAAASTFVGTNLGAHHRGRAKAAGWITAGYNFLFMAGLTVLYVGYAGPLVGFFDDEPAVLAAGREYLGIVAWSYGVFGVGLVLSQAMTGAGATLSSLVLDSILLLLFTVPAAYVVAEVMEQPRTVLWSVIAAGNLVGALAYAGYYAKGSFLDKDLRT